MRRNRTAIRRLLLFAILGTSAAVGAFSMSRARLSTDPMVRGWAAYERGDWEAAAGAARQRIKVARDDPEALRLLARALTRLGRDGAGLAIYDRLGPSALQVEDLCVLGQSLARAGKRDSALKVWEDARSRDPKHAETLFELSRVYLAFDRADDAARAAADLAVRSGWESRGEAILGAIRLDRNDAAGAVDHWRRARAYPHPTVRAEGLPDPLVPPNRFARALLRAGRPEEAGEQLHVVPVGSDDAEASWLLSRVALQRKDWPAARAGLGRSGGFRDEHPLQPEPAPYVGTARCAGCHLEKFRAQQASRHAQTFFRNSELGGVDLPGSPVPDPADSSVVHRLRRDAAGRIHQETTVAGRVLDSVVQYAFGSGDRGLTFVGRDRDGSAYELRLSRYRDVRGEHQGAKAAARWDRTAGHPRHPGHVGEYLGKPLGDSGIRRCLLCHVTDPEAIMKGSGACASDRAIGCERCHGPAGHHLLAVEGALAGIDPAIARPTLASAAEIIDLCSECHSPRGAEVRRDDPLAVRFQGTTLGWSRCYTQSDGALDCITCHDPHRDAATSAAHYEARCLECHARDRGRPASAGESGTDRRHARHRTIRESSTAAACPVNPSAGCIGCHMPAVAETTGAVFTDHFIRAHRD